MDAKLAPAIVADKLLQHIRQRDAVKWIAFGFFIHGASMPKDSNSETEFADWMLWTWHQLMYAIEQDR